MQTYKRTRKLNGKSEHTFSCFKTDRHDITGILLKVVLYTIPASLLIFLMCLLFLFLFCIGITCLSEEYLLQDFLLNIILYVKVIGNCCTFTGREIEYIRLCMQSAPVDICHVIQQCIRLPVLALLFLNITAYHALPFLV